MLWMKLNFHLGPSENLALKTSNMSYGCNAVIHIQKNYSFNFSQIAKNILNKINNVVILILKYH